MLRTIALGAGGAFLFVVLTYLFIPTSRIDALIAQVLAEQGLSLAPGAHKTLLPGLRWNDALLSSEQGGVAHFDRLRVRLQLLPLLMGRVGVRAAADIGKGQLDLFYGVTGREAFALHTDGINLTDIPIFKTVLGATASGNFWSEGEVTRSAKGLNGELKLEVKQLAYAGVKMGAFPLPDASNLRSQGMVRITDSQVRLESFTLQGEGIYMRLSGNLPGGAKTANAPLDLVLEIMPKPEFLERQKLTFLLLAKFQVSPGVYRVPIRGTLLKPEIF
ncbi:type II secretion system protein GspN [Geobacter sp. SVR]|nr:type II secretion system protein GspN [Geobacter sp. SVR]